MVRSHCNIVALHIQRPLLLSLCACARCITTATTLPPNQYDEQLQRVCLMAKEALSASTPRPWTPHSVQQGIAIFSRPSSNSTLQEIKGVDTLTCSPILLHALLSDIKHRVKWDPMVGSCRDVEDIDRLTHIAYATFKAPWPVSKREVVLICEPRSRVCFRKA
jgi:hypothetical protein